MYVGAEFMDVRQVFTDINIKNEVDSLFYKYCPNCGEKLTIVTKQEKARPKCVHCGFVHYKNPYPGVVVIIHKNDHILLGKRRATASFKPGNWCLPGGFIEFDESFLDAAHREVKEETGLCIEIHSIVNIVSNFLSDRLHTLVIVLSASAISSILKPGDDIEELIWHPLQEQLPTMAFESEEYIINQFALNHITELPIDSIGRFHSKLGDNFINNA